MPLLIIYVAFLIINHLKMFKTVVIISQVCILFSDLVSRSFGKISIDLPAPSSASPCVYCFCAKSFSLQHVSNKIFKYQNKYKDPLSILT